MLACAAVALTVVAGCGARPSAPAQAVAVTRPDGSTPFQLDAQASQIWLFLHADGPMSKLGHAHVITTHGLTGSIWLHPQTERSGCEFELPVATLVVDDAQERMAMADMGGPGQDAHRRGRQFCSRACRLLPRPSRRFPSSPSSADFQASRLVRHHGLETSHRLEET
jgi:hypothetical protein